MFKPDEGCGSIALKNPDQDGPSLFGEALATELGFEVAVHSGSGMVHYFSASIIGRT